MLELAPNLAWPDNIHMGVTVENTDYLGRMDGLRLVLAKIRWVSFEPLIGDMPQLNWEGIHWAVIGGELGPNARPMEGDWVRNLISQCRKAGVAIYVKQMGDFWRKAHHVPGGKGVVESDYWS